MLSIRDVRRQFLTELAYVCDYEKGGDTVTAIGLQNTPQGCVFWIAANTCPTKRVVPFLKSLLQKLQAISRDPSVLGDDAEYALSDYCIHFATKRIKAYRSLLRRQLRECTKHLIKKASDDCRYMKTLSSLIMTSYYLCDYNG